MRTKVYMSKHPAGQGVMRIRLSVKGWGRLTPVFKAKRMGCPVSPEQPCFSAFATASQPAKAQQTGTQQRQTRRHRNKGGFFKVHPATLTRPQCPPPPAPPHTPMLSQSTDSNTPVALPYRPTSSRVTQCSRNSQLPHASLLQACTETHSMGLRREGETAPAAG